MCIRDSLTQSGYCPKKITYRHPGNHDYGGQDGVGQQEYNKIGRYLSERVIPGPLKGYYRGRDEPFYFFYKVSYHLHPTRIVLLFMLLYRRGEVAGIHMACKAHLCKILSDRFRYWYPLYCGHDYSVRMVTMKNMITLNLSNPVSCLQ